MKKKLLITFTLALLVVSFAFTLSADSNSNIQACVQATGFSADLCANCTAAIGGAGDVGPCLCKLFRTISPDEFNAEFKNFGECVSFVQQNLR